MRVLAIDPGPTRSAWIVLRMLPAVGPLEIESFGLDTNDDLVGQLHHWSWGSKPIAGHLAVEMIQHYGTGMPAGASVFETCVWIGRFIQAWQPGDFSYVMRKDVKLHLCGNVRAKDSNVRQALIDRLGEPGTKKTPGPTYGIRKDLWQALGVAVTWCDSEAARRSVQLSSGRVPLGDPA